MAVDIIFFIFVILSGNAELWNGLIKGSLVFFATVLSALITLHNLYGIQIVSYEFISKDFYEFFSKIFKKVSVPSWVYYTVLLMLMRGVFYLIGKNLQQLMSIFPLFSVFNKTLGFAFGVLKGLFYLTIIINVMHFFKFYSEAVNDSYLSKLLTKYVNLTHPLCNKILEKIFNH